MKLNGPDSLLYRPLPIYNKIFQTNKVIPVILEYRQVCQRVGANAQQALANGRRGDLRPIRPETSC